MASNRHWRLIDRCLIGSVGVARYPPAASQIATPKTSVNLADIEGPIDKSLGTKEALAVRLRKLTVDGEKTLQGSQNFRTSRASRCSAFSV